MSGEEPSTGLQATKIIGGAALLLCALSAPFLVVPAIHKIPWMTTPLRVVNMAIKKAGPGAKRKWVDLGSGDGRIVLAAGKHGYAAAGYELNPVLLAMSYGAAAYHYRELHGRGGRVSFHRSDFWQCSLVDANVVSCFGIAPVMDQLAAKMVKESAVGTKLVCFRFYPRPPLPRGLYKVHADRKEELYVYEVR
jgi:hypothetical protein